MRNRRSGSIRGAVIPKTNRGILFMTSQRAILSWGTAAIARRCVCCAVQPALQWTLINIRKPCNEVVVVMVGMALRERGLQWAGSRVADTEADNSPSTAAAGVDMPSTSRSLPPLLLIQRGSQPRRAAVSHVSQRCVLGRGLGSSPRMRRRWGGV